MMCMAQRGAAAGREGNRKETEMSKKRETMAALAFVAVLAGGPVVFMGCDREVRQRVWQAVPFMAEDLMRTILHSPDDEEPEWVEGGATGWRDGGP